LATLLQTGNQRVDQLIHALQSTQARTVEMVVVVNLGLVLLREIANPTSPARLKSR
jgi:hypothetical protein